MSMTFNMVGGGSGIPGNRAVLVARVPSGATVMATKGGVVLTPMMWVSETYPDQDIALFVFTPAQFDATNPWTITATDGEETASAEVLITTNKEYEVTVTYRFYFVKNGALMHNRLVARDNAVITQDDNYYRFASDDNTVALVTSDVSYGLRLYSAIHLELANDGTRYGQSWYTANSIPVLGISDAIPTSSEDAFFGFSQTVFLIGATGNIPSSTYALDISSITDNKYVSLTVSGARTLSGTAGYLNVYNLYLE